MSQPEYSISICFTLRVLKDDNAMAFFGSNFNCSDYGT